ncbi:MAG: hypothetical protein A2X49_15250 [Lentisphaerae bacterium GWF2_52_8]|nr:MAG: hypothetical protein A2X49_15250 [Lentisphaerae bacterium GWF2_52_8]
MEDLHADIADSHVHIYHGFNDLDTINALQERTGVSAINIACLPRGTRYGSSTCFMSAFLRKKQMPGKTYLFAAFDYTMPGIHEGKIDFAAYAEKFVKAGADGFKMLEGKPDIRKQTGLPLDSKLYDPFYDYLQQKGLPLLMHVADPEEFWDEKKILPGQKANGWFWGDGSYQSKEALYAETESVLRKFPKLKLTLAHFFFLSADIDRAHRFLEEWQHVSLDITPGTEMYHNFSRKPEKWRDFFTYHADRILFGTDNSGHAENLDAYVNKYHAMRKFLETGENAYSGSGLELPEQALVRIYSGNFRERVGRRPAALDKAQVLNICQEFMASEHDKAAIEELKKIEKLLNV